MKDSVNSTNYFLLKDTETAEIYTLSLHDALPISISLGNVNDTVTISDDESATIAIGTTDAVTEEGGTDSKSTRLNTSHRTSTYTLALGEDVILSADISDQGGGTATGGGTDYNPFG